MSGYSGSSGGDAGGQSYFKGRQDLADQQVVADEGGEFHDPLVSVLALDGVKSSVGYLSFPEQLQGVTHQQGFVLGQPFGGPCRL